MTRFNNDNLSAEDAFWAMWYFLKEHYELSERTIGVDEILSLCEPMIKKEDGTKIPADGGMVDFWNEAVSKFKSNGIPDWKNLSD